MKQARLKIENLSKKFADIYAVKNVSFEVLPGEVHSLVGENGAGKSTIMKMIYGEIIPDEGVFFYNGQQVEIKNVSQARSLGIAMIHQEISMLSNLTVAENLFLGDEKMWRNSPFLNNKLMNDTCRELTAKYDFNISPKTPVRNLSVAQAQMLEIIKAAISNAGLIIMDEPTSSLSDRESTNLFKLIKELTAQNVSIIYISHRLEEVIQLSDRVTILRDGRHIGTENAKKITRERMIEMMVGRTVDRIYPKENVRIGEVVLDIRNFSSKGRFKNINFCVRSGEILGFSGLVGAGRSEIMQAIFGIDTYDSGEIYLEGRKIRIDSTADSIKHGISMVTEDRKELGLILCRPIRENITLSTLKKHFKKIFINKMKESDYAEHYKIALGIKYGSAESLVSKLSGGNQQKVVLAKCLLANPKVLIIDEPTRGIDVGAKFEIYKMLVKLAKDGIAIVMVSSELTEIIGMCDRILVVSAGKITSEYLREDIEKGKVTQKDLISSAL